MTDDNKQPEMFDDVGGMRLPKSELIRFYSEVGRDVVELGRMLRVPTAERPFVYEARFDLWPASSAAGLCVVKGFGEVGGLIGFQDGSGLVGQLRGLYDRCRSGKLRFTEDKYPPKNYEKRVKMYLEAEEYRAAKLHAR